MKPWHSLSHCVNKIDANCDLHSSACLPTLSRREGHNLAIKIKESIYIRVNNPTLNNNIGKFNLSHIWDRVLLNTKGLTLNRQGNNNNNQPNN